MLLFQISLLFTLVLFPYDSTCSNAGPYEESIVKDYFIAGCFLNDQVQSVAPDGGPLTVSIRVNPISFGNLIDEHQTFTILAELNIYWENSCVNWTEIEPIGQNLTKFSIGTYRTWYPSILHMNAPELVNIIDSLSTVTKTNFYKNYVALTIITRMTSFCLLKYVSSIENVVISMVSSVFFRFFLNLRLFP